jgi:hypothetical protein
VHAVSHIILNMLPLFRSVGFLRSAGVCALLAALPLCASASLITVDFDFSLNDLTGTGEVVYDPSLEGGTTDLFYADPTHGLSSFQVDYNGNTYTDTSASLLDSVTLPTVFLPGNEKITDGLTYEFYAYWVVSGTCTGTTTGSGAGLTYNGTCDGATLLVLGRTPYDVALFENVDTITITDTGDSLGSVVGDPNGVTAIGGSITGESVVPEPALFPGLLLALAALLFARRKAILS